MSMPPDHKLEPGDKVTASYSAAECLIVATERGHTYAGRFVIVEGADFDNWLVVSGGGVARKPVAVDPSLLASLNVGDKLRHKEDSEAMTIIHKTGTKWGYRLLLVRTYPVENPAEWDLLEPARR